MTRILTGATIALASLTVPSIASAQAVPAAIVIVVDTQEIIAECNACKTAQAQLQTQATQLQQRAEQLGVPIRTEAEAIEKAAGGKQPDAALQTRIQSLQTRQDTANKELQGRQQAFQRNRAYVLKQIGDKLNPIIAQTMQKRGANLAVDQQATLAAASAVDVTKDVLAQLNAQLPSIGTTAPAAPATTPSR